MWDECDCAVVWAFFGIAFLWAWNKNSPCPVLWPLLSFPNLLAYWVQLCGSLNILWHWNENWPFPILWPLLSFPDLLAYCARSLQLCPTVCNPMDSSPPGPSICGILQARTLEWIALPFYSTLTASSFMIWNSSAGIPSPLLALFIVMLPKAHLTSRMHSRMSDSQWVITPSWLSGSLRPFFVQFFCLFLPPLLNIFCFC